MFSCYSRHSLEVYTLKRRGWRSEVFSFFCLQIRWSTYTAFHGEVIHPSLAPSIRNAAMSGVQRRNTNTLARFADAHALFLASQVPPHHEASKTNAVKFRDGAIRRRTLL